MPSCYESCVYSLSICIYLFRHHSQRAVVWAGANVCESVHMWSVPSGVLIGHTQSYKQRTQIKAASMEQVGTTHNQLDSSLRRLYHLFTLGSTVHLYSSLMVARRYLHYKRQIYRTPVCAHVFSWHMPSWYKHCLLALIHSGDKPTVQAYSSISNALFLHPFGVPAVSRFHSCHALSIVGRFCYLLHSITGNGTLRFLLSCSVTTWVWLYLLSPSAMSQIYYFDNHLASIRLHFDK